MNFRVACFGIKVYGQGEPLAAGIKKLQNVIENLEKRNFTHRSSFWFGKVLQDKFIKL